MSAPDSVYVAQLPALDSTRRQLDAAYLSNEQEVVNELVDLAELPGSVRRQVLADAATLVQDVRRAAEDQGAMEAFMQQYDLSSEEGVLLMCLAEALLRIPDTETAEQLIKDKLGTADWEDHLGRSSSVFVNASTWGLMLTGKLVRVEDSVRGGLKKVLGKLVAKSGEPVIRVALRQAMKIMAHQYVMGRTIEAAIDRSRKPNNRHLRYSFDMLGEAALTEPDAERYLQAYSDAIVAIGRETGHDSVFEVPSISVKLSALHPRYEYAQRERVLAELPPRVLKLAQLAKEQGIALTVDAEEADRLMLSLDVFAAVYHDASLTGWAGLGLAVQGYQKRVRAVIAWLVEQYQKSGRRMPVRLVKGAYWDTEIKRCQEQGLSGYPVFTRKHNTDVSYLAAARELLAHPDVFYPQFATHNAHTLSAIWHMAEGKEFEYQRLHGMGESLHQAVRDRFGDKVATRVYAPVGSHEDLLPYLVRRLLENGANTSFVNRIVDESLAIDDLIADPVKIAANTMPAHHPSIPMPVGIYGPERRNSSGVNLASELELAALKDGLQQHSIKTYQVKPLLAETGSSDSGQWQAIASPHDHSRVLGKWQSASEQQVANAIEAAVTAQREWDRRGAQARADILVHAAELFEQHSAELISLLVREAGKTLPDCISELREAVDFLRYYAAQARKLFVSESLPGPTGESNQLDLVGRGVFVCISPWNFPLAIYIGQVAAALVAGNAVLAKPAEQTNAIAWRATQLLLEAGVPSAVLQMTPGPGKDVGAQLTADTRIAGVVFTGSTETARLINRTLAERDGPIIPLIAETGGQNAMLADSSSLPEQLTKDVLMSAFGSAGQRCSALRVLFIQKDVADRTLEILAGAMQELNVGDPALLATDVGPVIDDGAREVLLRHVARMKGEGRLIAATPLPEQCNDGTFVAPHAFEIDSLDQLQREVFGPVLHVIRYSARDMDQVLDAINATGYGLTLGVHSRIESTPRRVAQRVRAGNCYVNRNMIGAVVGVQPFGGEGLSGTGPKAGGPHYLLRFVTERTLTINTAAVGGNASLLALE